ncbi:MAG: hypothetical protein AB8B65_12225 [Kordia sp.]|uniref:hypothetical protein n=1 Tax=Kordia sp. TaxID=1965332 RepID=UPI0038598E6C
MKKKQINLKQLALKKSRVASLESENLTGGTSGWTGGFISWTGTAEPCFPTELGCGGITDGCPPAQTVGCPPPPTNGCPPPGTLYGCGQTALYSACNGYQCY